VRPDEQHQEPAPDRQRRAVPGPVPRRRRQGHARHFARKVDAQEWLDGVTTAVNTGTYTAPENAKTTVAQWCDTWIVGYGTRKPSTVRQAKTHIKRIKAHFGQMPLGSVRPSHVKSWTAALRAEDLEDSYVYALHARLAQVYNDAVHDGIVPRSPCSRRTSPGAGKQKPYVISTEQLWALYDAIEEWVQPAILLGAFAGLRLAEACGLRTTDVDFMRGVVHPAVQYPAAKLKTDASMAPVPIPAELALLLAAHVKARPGDWVVTNDFGRQVAPWTVQRAIREARTKVKGLPEEFSHHDLRHYLASLLIGGGADVKVVQARLRHASAKTTLDTYSHLWPDADESARAVVAAVLTARADSREKLLADSLRTTRS
jgi:integrase